MGHLEDKAFNSSFVIKLRVTTFLSSTHLSSDGVETLKKMELPFEGMEYKTGL
jgi:hypothetical protein